MDILSNEKFCNAVSTLWGATMKDANECSFYIKFVKAIIECSASTINISKEKVASDCYNNINKYILPVLQIQIKSSLNCGYVLRILGYIYEHQLSTNMCTEEVYDYIFYHAIQSTEEYTKKSAIETLYKYLTTQQGDKKLEALIKSGKLVDLCKCISTSNSPKDWASFFAHLCFSHKGPYLREYIKSDINLIEAN